MTLQPNVRTMIKCHSLHTMHFHIPSANNLAFECKIPCTTQRANIKVTTQHIHIHIFLPCTNQQQTMIWTANNFHVSY